MKLKCHFPWMACGIVLPVLCASAKMPSEVDVLVVGGTTKGVQAAVAAKAAGKSVYLVTPHAFLGEDMASTLELGYDAGKKPETPLERRLWRSIGGFAPFEYQPDHETDGIRWIFKNDRWFRIADPIDPVTGADGVLFIDDVTYRCAMRQKSHVDKVGVLVLEPERWLGRSILSTRDFDRIEKSKPGARRVATSKVSVTFLDGARKGEVVELARKGSVRDFPGAGWYSRGSVVLFEADMDVEFSKAAVKICVDPSAHHQLVSRIRFHLKDAAEASAPPTPLKVKRTYDRVLIESGVGFMTYSPLRRVFRDAAGRIDAVEIVNRSGRFTIKAKEVVDATLYGMLGRIPAVAGDETFSRIVISDRGAPSAPGMKVEEFAHPFSIPRANMDAKMYRCTFRLPMKGGSFPDFAAAEWAARELTKTERLVDAADLMVWHPSAKAVAGAKDVASGELPVWGEYDVVVVGGGTAGAPAAIAAARGGAKTLVVEFCDVLGGMGTDGMVLGFFDGNLCGFQKEFAAACKTSHGFAQYRRAETWRRMCREEGIDVWHGAMGVGALRQGDRVTGVEVASPLGCGIVKAKCVIDGTGNSDIAVAAGAETELVSAREIAVQSAGQSPHRLGFSINSDFGYLNDADADDLWLFSLRARAGAPDAWDMSKLPCSRERRRIVPDYRLSGEDVVARRRFNDTVAQALSRQDPHGYLTDDFGFLAETSAVVVPGYREDRQMFHVNLPLRSMLPKGIKGLAVVGLGAGIERDVVSITRMQSDLMNMGYGVGTAAAMALSADNDFRKIDLGELRMRLVGRGILEKGAIEWNTDDDCTSDEVIAKAVETLPDAFKGGHVLYRMENRARAIPLLRKAYRDSRSARSRQAYALALGLMGDGTAVDTLVAVVCGKEKIERIRGGTSADDSHGSIDGFMSGTGVYSGSQPFNGFMLALGRTRDRKAVAPLLAQLAKVRPGTELKDVRMVTLALEALGDPAAARPLAELLRADGMHGYSVKDASVLPPTGGYGVSGEYDLCFRELALARALMACGDFNGVARAVYESYAGDPRGLLAAHARAVLAKYGVGNAEAR